MHLFNLSKDPNEENNIAESNTAIVSEMESLLDEILEHNHKLEIKNNDLTSNEIENELRKMGYV